MCRMSSREALLASVDTLMDAMTLPLGSRTRHRDDAQTFFEFLVDIGPALLPHADEFGFELLGIALREARDLRELALTSRA